MKEYIERDAAINSLTEENLVLNLDSVMDGLSNQTRRSAHRILASLPAADVAPVRHGRWIVIAEFTDCVYAECDQCKIPQVFYYNKPLTNYCPNCGALMDKDGDGA